MIRVTVWNEYVHEREYEGIAKVYPKGIHGCIADFLGVEDDITVTCATLDMENQGISEELLKNTDVLIWWSHARQEDITDENVKLIQNNVLQGMGFIGLHSAHFSKPMKGIDSCIDIPTEEMYGEFFDIPKPDDVVFTGWFKGGEVFRSGCTFTRGMGKIFYFQPGHEEYPIYHMPQIQRIITNAVRWAAPTSRLSKPPQCVNQLL